MSNPNTFNNSNFQQTPLDSAYQFSTFSQYITGGGLNSRFSPNCIFCSSNNSTNLANDGSFKQCNSCKKQFKAKLLNNQVNQQINYFPPYRTN
jgi:hypothetical protein